MRHDDATLTLLGAADPLAGAPELEPGELEAAHDRVRAMLDGRRSPGLDNRGPGGPRPRRARPRWGRLLPGLVAVAAVVAGVMLVLGFAPGGKGPSPLEAAAAVAAQQPSTIPPGEYEHVAWTQKMPGVRLTVTEEWWVAADGSGRYVQRMTGRATPPGGHYLGVRFGPGRFTAMWAKYVYDLLGIDDPAALPTNPAALKSHLEGVLRRAELRNPSHWGAAADQPSGDQLVPEIGSALADPLDPPRLRSALFKVADSLSGVTVTRHVADPLGRSGTAVTVVAASPIPQPHHSGWARYRMIFDPKTSQILATELIPRSAGSYETFAVSRLVKTDHS